MRDFALSAKATGLKHVTLTGLRLAELLPEADA